MRLAHTALLGALLSSAALPAARTGQNAALLSTLLTQQSHLAELRGLTREAAAIRSESLGWALYGLGTEAAVETRLREVAAVGGGLLR